MTFSTVKSDPYTKGARRGGRARKLWSDQFWRRLVRLQRGETTMNEMQLQAIREENERIYGAAVRLEPEVDCASNTRTPSRMGRGG